MDPRGQAESLDKPALEREFVTHIEFIFVLSLVSVFVVKNHIINKDEFSSSRTSPCSPSSGWSSSSSVSWSSSSSLSVQTLSANLVATNAAGEVQIIPPPLFTLASCCSLTLVLRLRLSENLDFSPNYPNIRFPWSQNYGIFPWNFSSSGVSVSLSPPVSPDLLL